MKHRFPCLSLFVALILALQACAVGGSEQEAPAAALKLDAPASMRLHERFEINVIPTGAASHALSALPDTQVHDACDADRDGRWVRVTATFTHRGTSITVPGFAMRDEPGGAWHWRVRFSPTWEPEHSDVRFEVHVHYATGKNQAPVLLSQAAACKMEATRTGPGPLQVARADENGNYLYRTDGDSRRAVWLYGACRAWVVDGGDSTPWGKHEWIDRERELLRPMREAGMNLLNQWMAPWEYLIVHHDRAEHWRSSPRQWRRVPLAQDAAWTPYQCFDQGRAAAFDAWVDQCEGDAEVRPIHLLLSPLPHQCLQVREHPWGGNESGWSPDNDGGIRGRQQLNGFSGFAPRQAMRAAGRRPDPDVPEKLHIWDFFKADPHAPMSDWRGMLFDHQANFWRYCIARWGYSRAVGLWVIVDELDAVGDVVGSRRFGTGWWAHPDCERWLADTVRLFNGELRRSDGRAYTGDPFGHPIHAATTSYGDGISQGGNIEWSGTPGASPDVFGFHWYPNTQGSWQETWGRVIDGVAAYSAASPDDRPRLISEFGAPERSRPEDAPLALYPSLYHFAIWTAIFTGQAGTVLDWDDGKEFGELKAREREGPFDAQHYPVDIIDRVVALRMFLDGLDPETCVPCGQGSADVKLVARRPTRIFALHERSRTPRVFGWAHVPSGAACELRLSGLPAGRYRVMWFDPWTGTPVYGLASKEIQLRQGKEAVMDAREALERLRSTAEPFPTESREDRGYDVAFRIESADHTFGPGGPDVRSYVEGTVVEGEAEPSTGLRFRMLEGGLLDGADAALQELARTGEPVRLHGRWRAGGHKGLIRYFSIEEIELLLQR